MVETKGEGWTWNEWAETAPFYGVDDTLSLAQNVTNSAFRKFCGSDAVGAPREA
ncbi:hypothetical protein [Streptomyces sp. NPDC002994]|uniref:hypothetical protein n=1 Tax=Streptomyces sp. NPDC002994 TaxID=3154441 RepID=UPI0033A8CE33